MLQGFFLAQLRELYILFPFEMTRGVKFNIGSFDGLISYYP